MIHDPQLKLVATLTGARTYHFRSTTPLGGWALCTVNDATGELLIMSDYGNWAYRWTPEHLGSPSLTHFIADRNGYDYLANKLLDPRRIWEFDADATIKKWHAKLAEERLREGRRHAHAPECLRTRDFLEPLQEREPLTAEHAREIWAQLDALINAEHDEQIFIEYVMQIDGIGWVTECAWDETVHRPSHAYRLLVDFLLPVLAAACAETVKSQAA